MDITNTVESMTSSDIARYKRRVKKDVTLLRAPVTGEVVSLCSLEDPLIASRAFGEGCAIKMSQHEVRAPFDGTVKFVHSNGHALILEDSRKVQVLIHISALRKPMSDGTQSFVKEGDVVSSGQLMVKLDSELFSNMNYDLYAVVVVNEMPAGSTLLFLHKNHVNTDKSWLYAVGSSSFMSDESFSSFVSMLQ